MERYIREIGLTLGKMDARYIRLILVLLTLILFVLGAGAPGTSGGFSG